MVASEKVALLGRMEPNHAASSMSGTTASSGDWESGSLGNSSSLDTSNRSGPHSEGGHDGSYSGRGSSNISSFGWLHTAKRRWQGLPFTKRMGMLSSFIFFWVLLLHVLLMVQELEVLREVDEDSSIPENIQLLSELADSILKEKMAAVGFLLGQFSEAKYLAMTNAMDATDATSYNLVEGHLKEFLKNNGNGEYYSVLDATGINGIRDIRRGLSTKAVSSTAIDPRLGTSLGYSEAAFEIPPLQRVREVYNKALSKTVEVLTTQSTYYCRDLSISTHFQTIGLLLSAQHLIVSGVAGRWVLNFNGVGSSEFLTNWFSTAIITESYFTRFQYPRDDSGDLRITSARSQGVLMELQAALSSNIEPIPVNLTNQRTEVQAPMLNFLSSLAEQDRRDSSDFTRDTVVVAVIIAMLLYTIATWAHFEWFAFARVRRLIFTSNIMHDVHVRINEFVHAFGTFSLDLPPPPRTMQGTPVGVLELRLQQCLASLKAIAPSLPPLMFPSQAHAIAHQISSMYDPSTFSAQRRVRESLSEVPVELVPTDTSIEQNRFVAEMARITSCGSTVVHVACLAVDISCFDEVGSKVGLDGEGSEMKENAALPSTPNEPTTSSWVEDAFLKVVTCVESTVCQYGGTLHFVGLGSCVAVWCRPESEGPIDCETVVSCGALLGRRLNTLRRGNPQLMKVFKPYIGLTAGRAVRSIFGTSQSMKALQLFGAPLVFAHTVATVNQHHQTTLSCDQNVCDAIKGSRLCKPIEIIREGLLIDSDAERRGNELGDSQGGRQGVAASARYGNDTNSPSSPKSLAFGRVFEVLVAPSGKGSSGLPVDIEARLATYCKGFDLYERGFYREASRAFRAYTKQYGYDSSVERIQSAISVI